MDNWGGHVECLEAARLGRADFPLAVDRLELSGQSRLPIMGPSGAGKSTLLNILSGASFPLGGDARVSWSFPDGFACQWRHTGPSEVDLLTLRRDYFGYAFQAANLQPQLTVGENLTFALINKGVSQGAARKRALDAMQSVFGTDVAPLMDRFESEISGGERQRVALLAAMIGDPYVLFADEPTGSLDPATRRDVMGILERWLDEKPGERMLVWVTHHGDDPALTGASKWVIVDGGRAWIEAVR